MQRLSQLVIDNIVEKCAGKEIDFMIFLSKRQDCLGYARGIVYTDATEALGICKQTFYNIVDSLEKKGLVEVDWNDKKYWNFRIIDNVFRIYQKDLFDKDVNKGYVSTNRDFLYTKDFMELKDNEKKLTLQLLGFMDERDPYKKYKIKIENLMNWISLSNKSLMKEYIETLKQWFIINQNEDLLLICLKEVFFKAQNTEKINWLSYKVFELCRKMKVTYTPKEMADTIRLLIRHAGRNLSKFIAALCESISLNKTLQPALINHIITHRSKEQEKLPERGSHQAASSAQVKSQRPGQGNYRKPSFDNFEKRQYDSEALSEYLKMRDNPEAFAAKYEGTGITLQDLFNKTVKR